MLKQNAKPKKRQSAAKHPGEAESASSARQAAVSLTKDAPAKSAQSAKTLDAKEWKNAKFVISHLRDEDFVVDGLRPYAAYRDLGVAEATKGMVRAHVIRNVRSFNAKDVSKRHYHDVDFQLIYCLKGSMKSEMDGKLLEIKAGTCWIQPPGVKHTVLGYSDDLELLEIVLPAEFETVDVDPL